MTKGKTPVAGVHACAQKDANTEACGAAQPPFKVRIFLRQHSVKLCCFVVSIWRPFVAFVVPRFLSGGLK